MFTTTTTGDAHQGIQNVFAWSYKAFLARRGGDIRANRARTTGGVGVPVELLEGIRQRHVQCLLAGV